MHSYQTPSMQPQRVRYHCPEACTWHDREHLRHFFSVRSRLRSRISRAADLRVCPTMICLQELLVLGIVLAGLIIDSLQACDFHIVHDVNSPTIWQAQSCKRVSPSSSRAWNGCTGILPGEAKLRWVAPNWACDGSVGLSRHFDDCSEFDLGNSNNGILHH